MQNAKPAGNTEIPKESFSTEHTQQRSSIKSNNNNNNNNNYYYSAHTTQHNTHDK
jgi:hypothetical protein